MTSKIRIKMGAIEVEYEGTEEFLKEELPDLLSAVSQLYAQSGLKKSADAESKNQEIGGGSTTNGAMSGTTATFAAKLKCKKGTDLVMAGAARLTLVTGKAEFSRQELLDELKTAAGYFKASVRNNLGNYLQKMVRAGDLVEPRSGHYAISPTKLEEVRQSLAA